MPTTSRLLPLLLALLATASSGCGVLGGPSPTPTPTLTPTITQTPTATPTATPSPTPTPQPQVETPSLEVTQGGAAVLRVRGVAASATASFDGLEYPLIPKPDGFWGVIGVAADGAPGAQPASIVLRDGGGRTVAELGATVTVLATTYPVEDIHLAPGQSALLDPALAEQERVTREAVFAAFTPERLWSGAFIVPVPGAISSPYGIGRSYNGGPVTSFHHGTDFSVDENTPVAASNAGRVAFVGDLPIRGRTVIIDHGAGVFSGYHHLTSATVQQGQSVATGDLIGYSGASGLVTGPHLHWEIIVRGVEVDPTIWTFEEIGP